MKIASLLGLVVGAGLLQTNSRTLSAQDLNLSVQSVRATLQQQRATLTQHPDDLGAYINLAYTLSDAGMNDQAIQTMRKAIGVAPNSALAYDVQAWVLRHNAVGEDFGKGFNYDEALASYHKAIVLTPDDMDLRERLANLLQYNRDGVEYGSGANLPAAIETYRFVEAHQHPVAVSVQENLAIALFYSGLFQEAAAEVASVPTTTPYSAKLKGVQVAAITAIKGAAAGIDTVAVLKTPEQRKETLAFAAEGLWNMRLYSQAADLLSASLPNPEVHGIAAKIQLFRQLKTFNREDLLEGDPRRPVQKLLTGVILETLTRAELSECVVPALLRSGAADEDPLNEVHGVAAVLRSLSKKTGLPAAVVQDIALGNMNIRTIDSGEPGARVVVSIAGASQIQFFVLPDNGTLKVAGESHELRALGREALALLSAGREMEATALLNWGRELAPNSQSDDPLGGTLFTRVWSPTESKGQSSTRMAAASVIQDPAELRNCCQQSRMKQPKTPRTSSTLPTNWCSHGSFLKRAMEQAARRSPNGCWRGIRIRLPQPR